MVTTDATEHTTADAAVIIKVSGNTAKTDANDVKTFAKGATTTVYDVTAAKTARGVTADANDAEVEHCTRAVYVVSVK